MRVTQHICDMKVAAFHEQCEYNFPRNRLCVAFCRRQENCYLINYALAPVADTFPFTSCKMSHAVGFVKVKQAVKSALLPFRAEEIKGRRKWGKRESLKKCLGRVALGDASIKDAFGEQILYMQNYPSCFISISTNIHFHLSKNNSQAHMLI